MSTIFNGITPRHSDLNPLKRLLCKVIIIRLEAVVTAGTCLAQASQLVKSNDWKSASPINKATGSCIRGYYHE
jgi:hypothetical protein